MARSPSTKSEHAKQELALDCVEIFGQLAALFDERRRQLAEVGGLTVQQWHVLEEITSEHFMPTMFAQQRESSPAAVSKILRQLTDKGIITAHVSEHDARKREYEVTTEGKKLLARVRKERQRAIDEVWLKLGREDLEAFQLVGSSLARRLQTWADENRSNGKP